MANEKPIGNISEFFLTKLIRMFGKKLDGKVTYIGAAGKILIGLLGIIGIALPVLVGDDLGYLPKMDLETALGLIMGGFAVFSGVQGVGVRRAINKQGK